MAIYTVYAYIGKRNTRKAVHTFHEIPISYADLKSILLEAAQPIYYWQNHQTETLISIERHMPGRYKRGTTSYRSSRIRYGRQPQFRCKLTYIHNQNRVKVEQAQFLTPEFYAFAPDYYTEHNRKWQIPKVTPSGFAASLRNPAIMLHDLVTLRTLAYGAVPQGPYASQQERTHAHNLYSGRHVGSHMAANWAGVEWERQEKQTKH